MCFLLAGTRILLLVLRYNSKRQLGFRAARPRRWLQRAAVPPHWPQAARRPGPRDPAPGPRAARWGGTDSATPAPRPAGGPGLFSKTLSLAQVNFLF